jgi:ABC-type oligopeptide transport system substrate-binding subunit
MLHRVIEKLAIAFCAAGLLLATGCPGHKSGGGTHAKQPVSTAAVAGGKLRLPLEVAPDDPALKTLDFSDARLFALARCLEIPLVRGDAAGKLSPGLASAWSTADGGKTWVFTLRVLPGHEADPSYAGKLLQARFKELLDGAPGPLQAQIMDLVSGAKDAKGNATSSALGLSLAGDQLTLTLTRQHQLAPLWLSQPGLGVLPGRAIPSQGFGPFLISSVEQGALILKPNPQALDDKPLVDELHFVLEPNRAKQLEMFRHNDLDTANLSIADAQSLASDASFKDMLVQQQTAAVIHGMFNLSHFPWGDSKFQSKLGLRQALNLSLDREYLATSMQGQLTAWQHFLPEAMKDAIDPALLQQPTFPLAPSIDAAMAAEKAADHEQGSKLIPGMDFAFLKQGMIPQLADLILQDWKQISIKMRPLPLSQEELTLRLDSASHEIILRQACPAYADPDALFYPLLYGDLSGVGGNWQYLKDAEVDRRIAEAQTYADPVARKKLYRELSADLEQRALGVFLGYSSPTLLISPRLAGYKLTPYDFDASLPAQDFTKLGLAPPEKLRI